MGVGLSGRSEEEKQLTGNENRNVRYTAFQKPTMHGILRYKLFDRFLFDSLLK